jgi:hypothetical protein
MDILCISTYNSKRIWTARRKITELCLNLIQMYIGSWNKVLKPFKGARLISILLSLSAIFTVAILE